jgi:hypothetical protein
MISIPVYQPHEFDIRAQVACVRREIYFRKTWYPKWLASGRSKMTPDEAGKGIACMEAVLTTLETLSVTQNSRSNPELPGFRLAPP